MAHITKQIEPPNRRFFVKAYLPKSDVDRVKREAKKKRISASSYVAQLVLEHLESLRAA